MDKAQVWLESFIISAKQLIQESKIVPKGICISGNGPSLVSIDKTGEKTFTLMWDEFQAKNISDTKSIFIPRLFLLKQKFPELFNDAKIILNCPEFLIYSLTGKAVTVIPEKRFLAAYWSRETLLEFGLEKAPLANDFVPSGFEAGILLPQFLSALGVGSKARIPVFCGGPDFITALIGTGTIFENTILDRAGSSEGINLCTKNPEPVNDAGSPLRILPSMMGNFWNKSVILPDSGKRFSQWKKQSEWKNSTYEECVRDLLELKEKDRFQYERDTRVLFSILENVKTSFERILSESSEGKPVIRCCGGQAKNSEWMKLKANAVGLPLEVTNSPDSELSGCAILAFTRLSVYKDLNTACSKMIHTDKIFLPDV